MKKLFRNLSCAGAIAAASLTRAEAYTFQLTQIPVATNFTYVSAVATNATSANQWATNVPEATSAQWFSIPQNVPLVLNVNAQVFGTNSSSAAKPGPCGVILGFDTSSDNTPQTTSPTNFSTMQPVQITLDFTAGLTNGTLTAFISPTNFAGAAYGSLTTVTLVNNTNAAINWAGLGTFQ